MKDANYGCKDEGNDDEVISQSVISQSDTIIITFIFTTIISIFYFCGFFKKNLHQEFPGWLLM